MQNIFIVRHGQDEDNAHGILNGRRNTPLTETGREQARSVAEKLRQYNIDVIISSPLSRALETAHIIAETIGVSRVIPLDILIEREFGVLTGKPVADIPKYSEKNILGDKITYFLEVEGAETFPILYQRGMDALVMIQKEYPDQNCLIVAHGDIGKMIQAAYYGWSWEQALHTPYLDNMGVLELKSD